MIILLSVTVFVCHDKGNVFFCTINSPVYVCWKQEKTKKTQKKTHTYHGFSYNVKEKYLGTYKYECSNLICYKCGRM